MENFTQVATIPKTALRCKSEGIGISEKHLRQWCNTGVLKHTKVGNVSLIYWPNLMSFLEQGTPCEEKTVDAGTIRRIAE